MIEICTGPIGHDQLIEEILFIQEIHFGAGVRSVIVCCAFGVDVDHPLFARDVEIKVDELADYLAGHERAGSLRVGQTNITLTTRLQGLEFFLGNDEDVFCRGEESPRFRPVRERWTIRYPSTTCRNVDPS